MENQTKPYADREVIYLITLIKSAIRGEQAAPVQKAPQGLNWQRLYNIAKRHMVTALVFSWVQEAGGCPKELLEKWEQKANIALIKEVQFDAAREEIFEEFDKNGIDYLPLKGIITKDFYPKKGVRQFSDNDILIREKDKKKLCAVMRALEYTNDGLIGAHFIFKKEPFFNFEIHVTLFNKDISLYDYFCDAWDRAIKNDSGCGYHMTDEDFYIFFLAHFYKHFKIKGGCGLRFFADLYLVQRALNNLNRGYVVECLEKTGMIEFEKEVTSISESFFGDGDVEINPASLKYIIESGAYGTSEHIVEEKMQKDGKFLGALKMAFPSLKSMQRRYRILDKLPVLLPVFYVVYWISMVFVSEKRARLKVAVKKFFSRRKKQ